MWCTLHFIPTVYVAFNILYDNLRYRADYSNTQGATSSGVLHNSYLCCSQVVEYLVLLESTCQIFAGCQSSEKSSKTHFCQCFTGRVVLGKGYNTLKKFSQDICQILVGYHGRKVFKINFCQGFMGG